MDSFWKVKWPLLQSCVVLCTKYRIDVSTTVWGAIWFWYQTPTAKTKPWVRHLYGDYVAMFQLLLVSLSGVIISITYEDSCNGNKKKRFRRVGFVKASYVARGSAATTATAATTTTTTPWRRTERRTSVQLNSIDGSSLRWVSWYPEVCRWRVSMPFDRNFVLTLVAVLTIADLRKRCCHLTHWTVGSSSLAHLWFIYLELECCILGVFSFYLWWTNSTSGEGRHRG